MNNFVLYGPHDRRISILAMGCLAIMLRLAGCLEEYNPVIDPSNFVAEITNPLLPMSPGTTFVYEANIADGLERIETSVLNDTKVILGVTCAVVHDTMPLDGNLAEDTLDWYAQDKDGNVWYFGEDSKTIESGVVVSTEGGTRWANR